MKQCYKCKVYKPHIEFGANKRAKDGLTPYCKPCKRSIAQEWAKNNSDRVKQSDKLYRLNNSQTVKNRKRKYYESHKDKLWERQKHRLLNDINFKLKCNLRIRLNKAARNNQKSGSAIKDLGCSIDYFKKHIESLWIPGMNWENYGNRNGQWSFDHILPLSKFDLSNREEFLKACHYTNIQPMWHIDNVKKSNG